MASFSDIHRLVSQPERRQWPPPSYPQHRAAGAADRQRLVRWPAHCPWC